MGAPLTPFGFPSELYHCLLDEQPYYLAPSYLLDNRELLSPALVNPACWFSWHGDLPNHMAARVDSTDQFCPGDVVWVEDPATLALWPFWVGEEYFGYLSRMVPGSEPEVDLPEHVRWVLTQANILVEPNYPARLRLDWRKHAMSYASEFEQGYVPVPGLIHPFHVGALRRYYRCRTRNGYFFVGDEQVRRRFAAHNEPVARFVHHQLTHALSDISGAVLKPSYAYFVSYLSGALGPPRSMSTGSNATTALPLASMPHRNRARHRPGQLSSASTANRSASTSVWAMRCSIEAVLSLTPEIACPMDTPPRHCCFTTSMTPSRER